jgi:hypothetical protein
MPKGYNNLTGLPVQLGRKHSEETKIRIGLLKVGNKNCLGKHWKMPENAKIKIREYQLTRGSDVRVGITHSEEAKEKKSEIMKKEYLSGNRISYWAGKKQPLSMRLKRSESNSGDKCYKWKGGISSENEILRKSIEYRLWREAVFARDNFTCQKCAVRGGQLNAHHIKQFSQFPELRLAIDNGITLCEACHLLEPKECK